MPVLINRPLATFPIGNIPLDQHKLPIGFAKHPHAWINRSEALAFLQSGKSTLIDAKGNALAFTGIQADLTDVYEANISFLIVHSWELLKANEDYVSQLNESSLRGEIHSSAVIEGHIHLGKGSRILPGVFIEGNVIIGENCKIGPNCYLRGASSIGDHCHIGQAVEIKNSIILSHTSIGHLSYVGDSVIGHKVNFGAGTITSNLRHDGKNHRTQVCDELIDTGRRKFGTIVGDHVHTGINTSIYPGRKIFPNCSTLPGDIVQKDIH
jgi:UDP-N-acetylglucosamine diphosphorylase / glucose-1-phosphate thymidylyltransferase / UDP-N-acetylgalactosamine diphosphorylase / glucosamine-1-phosphate N-acetyltransferase / galactosamine-1-phosphate N-acetyltransferase